MPAISSFRFYAPCTAGETHMSVAADPVLRPGGLPAWTLNRTVAGAGRFRLCATLLDTVPGDLVLLAPGVYNHYGPAPQPGGWVHQWSVFEAADHWHDLLAWPSPAPGLRHLRCAEEPLDAQLGARFEDLIASVQGVHPRHRDIGLALVHAGGRRSGAHRGAERVALRAPVPRPHGIGAAGVAGTPPDPDRRRHAADGQRTGRGDRPTRRLRRPGLLCARLPPTYRPRTARLAPRTDAARPLITHQ